MKRKINMNYNIRRTIEDYLKLNGSQNTRIVIGIFAQKFNTTKQRISGNISYMKCHEHSIYILSNKPNSIAFLI